MTRGGVFDLDADLARCDRRHGKIHATVIGFRLARSAAPAPLASCSVSKEFEPSAQSIWNWVRQGFGRGSDGLDGTVPGAQKAQIRALNCR